jgi:hypothetical protein
MAETKYIFRGVAAGAFVRGRCSAPCDLPYRYSCRDAVMICREEL